MEKLGKSVYTVDVDGFISNFNLFNGHEERT